jgi:hypothetical protein
MLCSLTGGEEISGERAHDPGIAVSFDRAVRINRQSAARPREHVFSVDLHD